MTTQVEHESIVGVGKDKNGRVGIVITTDGNGYPIEDLYDGRGAPVQANDLGGNRYDGQTLYYKPKKTRG